VSQQARSKWKVYMFKRLALYVHVLMSPFLGVFNGEVSFQGVALWF
jgi:hypothetical protein